MRTFLAVKGVPLEGRTSDSKTAFKWPEAETVERWENRINKIESALKRISKVGCSNMKLLCIQEREIAKGAEDETVAVLLELARLTWLPEKKPGIRVAHINPNALGPLAAE
jgi:hypothetical protein